VNEPDRFEPSAPKTRVAQALRLNFGCPSEDREGEPGDNPWVRDSRHPNKSVRANYAFCERGSTCSKKKPEDTTVSPIYAVWENPAQATN
jgi:hypothetical protein